MSDDFRSGFVAIIGKPNVGKSTLMNRLVGEKIAIVSEKPQTTRHRLLGILSCDTHQIVFVDTPGIIKPRDAFNECLVENARRSLDDVDLIYVLLDATDPEPLPQEVIRALNLSTAPKFLLLNKIDLLPESPGTASLSPKIDMAPYAEFIPISALTGYNLETLLEKTIARLPKGHAYYDPEQLSDRDERFLVAEMVREKVFSLTGQEIPYAVATQVDEFKEREEGKYFIRVIIYVEKESQKGIIIGAGGQLLKRIGKEARRDIEVLVRHPVFLELWVKVRKNWRKKASDLRQFGFWMKKK
jgi:GTP-binding protein Era